MKTCIIVSPYFPPAAVAGVHRARHLVKHLSRHGWHPKLICVDERHYEQEPDSALAALVPAKADIEKVGAVPVGFTRQFGLGEISLRAFAQLRGAVLAAASQHDAKAIIITGSPYYPMLLAPQLKKCSVAVILDFQDPWVSKWGATQPLLSKAGLSHWLATRLEPRAVRSADFITSVSDQQNLEMRERYPDLDADKFAAIPIGGDPDDFALLRARGIAADLELLGQGKFNLSFVGTFMPRSSPLMHEFLAGVRQFRIARPDLAGKVRFNFVGTGNHSQATQARVTEIAREFGVDDLVYEMPRRIAFSRAIAALAQSDAILLIGSDEPHYTASKIYPGLMCGRPFLSLFHGASSSHAILRAAGGGIALDYDPARDLAFSERVSSALIRLVSDPGSLGAVDQSAYAAFEAGAIAGRFAAILDRLVASG